MSYIWNDAEIERFKTLWRDGVKVTEISRIMRDEFGRTILPSSVSTKARRLGLSRRGAKSWSEDEDGALRSLWTNPNLRLRDIARNMDSFWGGNRSFSVASVYLRAINLGLPSRRDVRRAAAKREGNE